LQDAEEAERRDKMNGAESLVRTLVGGGVEVCFANPGTSEMHFVAALDRVDGMRCVLGLFEGVVTGAADGYYRMSDKPAATLLHLGPGLPDIDWVGLAKSLGVPGARVADMDGFNRRFAEGLATPGPYLVEVVV
jgi:thiamine pyrophosphate-dependent acetolactate synthase large subunit-like protein